MTESIQRLCDQGKNLLVIELVSKEARVMSQDDVFAQSKPGQPVQFVMMELGPLLTKFECEAPPRPAFTLQEVAKIINEKAPTLNSWIKAGILKPSVRDRDGTKGRAMLFDRTDAFVGCVVAALHRKCKLPLSLLTQVSTALRGADEEIPASPRKPSKPKSATRKPKRKKVKSR